MSIVDNWDEVAKRIKDAQKELGVKLDTFADKLQDYQYHVTGGSLGHNLRGRVPSKPFKLVTAVSRYFGTEFSAILPHLDSETAHESFQAFFLGVHPANPLNQEEHIKSSRRRNIQSKSVHLDLWTPGITQSDIATALRKPSDSEVARKIFLISNEAIKAIGSGDFKKQLKLAESAIELGNIHPNSMLLPEGFYLKAEAQRLLADFESDRDKARMLRQDAIDLYDSAEEALFDDARVFRGRARTHEALGNPDKALEGFKAAVALTETNSASELEASRFSWAHESIRSLRHKIACLANIHDESPKHTEQARSREADIKILLAASIKQHQNNLPLFRDSETWWRIEWFMAQVLHAKSFLAIGEKPEAARHLIWALKQRASMVPASGKLSHVELGNFDWWGRTAKRVESEFTNIQITYLEEMLNLIGNGGERSQLIAHVERFLAAGEEPWNL